MKRIIGAGLRSFLHGKGIIKEFSNKNVNNDYDIDVEYSNEMKTYRLTALVESKKIVFDNNDIKEYLVEIAKMLKDNCVTNVPIKKMGDRDKKLESLIPQGIMLGEINELRYGYNYGTNSRKIYERCCETLHFNEAWKGEFGHNRPLYARKAVKGEYSVWFISYSNLNEVVEDKPWHNIIYKDMHIEEEYIDTDYKRDIGDKRLIFIKTKETGYIFVGLYEQRGDKFSKHKHPTLAYELIKKDYK